MAHSDRPLPVVSNHQTIKQVIDWLLAPAVFAHLRGSRVATWKPRLLAATALLWATSDLSTLHERFTQARKIITKVFRWQGARVEAIKGLSKCWATGKSGCWRRWCHSSGSGCRKSIGRSGRRRGMPCLRGTAVVSRWPEARRWKRPLRLGAGAR